MTPQPFHYKCEDCGWTGNDAKTIRLEDHCPNCNSLELTTIPTPSQPPSVEKKAEEEAVEWAGKINNDVGSQWGYVGYMKGHAKGYIAGHTSRASEIQALQKEVEGMRKDIIHLNGQCDLRDGLIQQLQQENERLNAALDFVLNHQETGSFSKWYQSIRTVAWKARYPEEEDTWSDKS